jgi:hypothetical protein
MKQITWEIRLGIVLLGLSLVMFAIKFIVIGNPAETVDYVLNALGFLPIDVLLVTLILTQLMSMRAKQEQLEKLNMVIGAFFSEIGTELLETLAHQDHHLEEIRNRLVVSREWTDKAFREVRDVLAAYAFKLDMRDFSLSDMTTYFVNKREFMLRLLENPILLEHQVFTDMLRALFHLTEELIKRKELQALPDSDYQHLSGDLNRAYHLLVLQWLAYMKYLHTNYPYLFSFAMRTNPFDPHASAVIGD